MTFVKQEPQQARICCFWKGEETVKTTCMFLPHAMERKILVLLLLPFFALLLLLGQVPSRTLAAEVWKVYKTSNSGLAGNIVIFVTTDLSGNKWFGTYGSGASVFDGINWTTYNTSNSGIAGDNVYCIDFDASGNTWFGCAGAGVSKFDGTNWTTYNSSNSGLAGDWVTSMAIDSSQNKWFTTTSGVSEFDGSTWTTYDPLNSGLTSYQVIDLAIDAADDKWFGGVSGGVSKFDGSTWTNYNTSNSGLADDYVISSAVDSSQNKWFGTFSRGASMFDGSNWTTYNSSNSGLATDTVSSLGLDPSGEKWFGTRDGLSLFDGTNWTTYKTSNSGLPNNQVLSIALDPSGEKWFAAIGGVAKLTALNSTTFYFAEGCTSNGFEEWLCLQNPNPTPTDVTIAYMFRDGGTQTQVLTLAADARETISVNSVVGRDKEVSMKVEASQAIVAERPMYFDYRGIWQGGHNTIGATAGNTSWYFAEGCTDPGFETWLTLQNPANETATADITYMYRDGTTKMTQKTIESNSRETVNINTDAGSGKELSIKVESNQQIIAERPMYFNYRGIWSGGHDAMGATSPSNNWYFAEGCTRDGFDEWLCLQNPNSTSTDVTIEYLGADGSVTNQQINIPANARNTVDVKASAGRGKEVSIKIVSDQPIVAERPVYFCYHDDWTGGHSSLGATDTTSTFYLAEGYTGKDFEEWICLLNPYSAEAIVNIEYKYRGGGGTTQRLTVGPSSRKTVNVNAAVGSGKEVLAKITANQQIIAERTMYFDYEERCAGGHNVVGF
jgi:hypothetical protein